MDENVMVSSCSGEEAEAVSAPGVESSLSTSCSAQPEAVVAANSSSEVIPPGEELGADEGVKIVSPDEGAMVHSAEEGANDIVPVGEGAHHLPDNCASLVPVDEGAIVACAEEGAEYVLPEKCARVPAEVGAVVPAEITSHGEGACNVHQVILPVTAEGLWRKAIEEEDCEVLTELLAKDGSCFWKYEHLNSTSGGTLLHVAARRGDVMLAERVVDALVWAEERKTGEVFNDSEFKTGRDYVEAVHPHLNRTAEEMANEHESIIGDKIRAYIANDKQRAIDSLKIKAADGSSSSDVFSHKKLVSEEQMKWNNAIQRRDCQALLELLGSERLGWAKLQDHRPRKFYSTLLKDDMKKAAVKCGKEDDRTALHIAAMQGCFELVKSVLHQVCAQTPDSSNDVVCRYIRAVDYLSGLTAFEMANDIIGNRSISEYIRWILEAKGGKIKHLLQSKIESDSYRTSVSFEAYPDTRWYMALERGDKDIVKKLVESNSRLLLETCHGLTVLHVAILWDDVGLVEAVVKLFGDRQRIEWHINSYYPRSLKLEHMIAVSRTVDYGNLNKYWDETTRSWVKLPSNTMKQLKRGGNSVVLLAEKLGRTRILEELKKPKQKTDQKSDVYLELSQPCHPLPTGLYDFLGKNWILPPEFQKEFNDDVDFNFEFDEWRKVWLRFHCACKQPVKFKDLLQQVSVYIQQHPYDGFKLFQMCDAQGRTPFHILLDNFTDQNKSGWVFDEIFNDDYYKEWIQVVEDARGKRIIDIVLIKNYLQRNIDLQPWKYFNINFHHDNFERSVTTTLLYYQVAFLLKQRSVAEEIWSRFIVQKNMKRLMKKDHGSFKSLLFFAASTGNHTYLQSLLEADFDPMITDGKGRSLLHHAADATLLQSLLVRNFSSTVKDVCDVRNKWIEQTSVSSKIVSASHDINSATKFVNHNPIVANSSIQDIAAEELSNAGRKACILMLLQAGVDLAQADKHDKVPDIGPTIDAEYQIWWYEMGGKDSMDKKSGFSQAGNALSVVGTLVAAASYAGPAQPPMSYNDAGFVKFSEPLVKWFMVSNSVAFYLAMASVMFAVVSSLPMPQEGVMSELKRAKHVVSLSLCLLLIAIGSIIISFATASMVVIQDEHPFLPKNLLFGPAIIGLFFCFIGISGFLIRLARLILYKSSIVRKIYHFSVSWFCWLCIIGIVLCLFVFILFSFLIALFLVVVLFIFSRAFVHYFQRRKRNFVCLIWCW